MSGSNTATRFPVSEISVLDKFLLKNGAKRMATTPKETATSPMEWNKSVLGLTATLIAILGVLVGFVWNYAVLSTKFELQQQKILQLESQHKDLKTDIDRMKEFQLKSEAYRLGVSDSHAPKEEKK